MTNKKALILLKELMMNGFVIEMSWNKRLETIPHFGSEKIYANRGAEAKIKIAHPRFECELKFVGEEWKYIYGCVKRICDTMI